MEIKDFEGRCDIDNREDRLEPPELLTTKGNTSGSSDGKLPISRASTGRIDDAALKPIIGKHIEFWYGRGLNERDSLVGATPFVEACERGDETSVFLLLLHVTLYLDGNKNDNYKLKGDQEETDDGNGLNCITNITDGICSNGFTCLPHREDFVNAKDDYGITALHELAAHGYTSILHIVICFTRRHKIPLNIHARDSERSTAIHFAAKNGHDSIIKMLLDYERQQVQMRKQNRNRSTDTNLQSSGDDNNLRSIIHAKGNDGWNAMHFAVFHNHESVVQTLLDAAAEPESTLGIQSLSSSAATSAADTTRPKVELLQMVNARDSINGRTPLHLAALNGHVTIMDKLLSNGANLHARDRRRNRTALMMASAWCKEECVTLLLKNGANVHDQDNQGLTALDLAISNGANQTILHMLWDRANIG